MELTNVVARGDPFQLTTERFTKFVPVTVSISPARAHDADEVAVTVVIAGPDDVPPPGVGFTICTCAVPAAEKSLEGTTTLSDAAPVEGGT